jgi:hypothetical protein
MKETEFRKENGLFKQLLGLLAKIKDRGENPVVQIFTLFTELSIKWQNIANVLFRVIAGTHC